MELWQTAVLSVIIATGILFLILYARRKGKKKWMLAAIAAASIVLFMLIAYSLLALIFLDAVRNQ